MYDIFGVFGKDTHADIEEVLTGFDEKAPEALAEKLESLQEEEEKKAAEVEFAEAKA